MAREPDRGEPVDEIGGDLLEEVQSWTRAVVFGTGDTLREMLRAGRRAAREAADDYWDRFDKKTKRRR